MMGHIPHLLSSVVLLLALQACVVPMGHAPGYGHVPPEVVTRLKTLRSTRADILMTLGAPDQRFLGDRVFGYLWTETVAAVLFPAGYQVGGFNVDEKRTLLIEFDPLGTMLRVEVLGAVREHSLNTAIDAWLEQAGKRTP